jgi:hypothetical protein
MFSNEFIEKIKNAMASSGKTALLKWVGGGKLTLSEAILAKCCKCQGYYKDGKKDCEVTSCPLYFRMPYCPGKRWVRKERRT